MKYRLFFVIFLSSMLDYSFRYIFENLECIDWMACSLQWLI
ncbi:Uncharacterised protein [Streptococcus pneumoniae]|nr:Uncharacterised protein [Streptococcus pneumoniae]VKS08910.1 Uncharacterised protein [Streptococcus pneumoniae]VKU68800.1 Uncharacterised protein [Streptococcus pneumoniae]VLD59395.1 Uncharacterised protein [Streptococcus pneumoniae]VLL33282.1 Uncharacterised protein [Streptococcus pneumoniae]